MFYASFPDDFRVLGLYYWHLQYEYYIMADEFQFGISKPVLYWLNSVIYNSELELTARKGSIHFPLTTVDVFMGAWYSLTMLC